MENNNDFYTIIAADIYVRNHAEELINLQHYDPERIKKTVRKAIRKMYKNKNEYLFRITFWYRVLHSFPSHSLKGIVGRVMYRHYNKKQLAIIGCNKIGKGLHIVHDSCLFINAEKIGDFFTIFQNVTIGVDRKGGRPTIGNNVRVYSNAVICGNITIGDNCIIGANAFVNRDLPADSVVISQSTVINKKT